MDFHNFDLEEFQSRYERTVEYNLADSSVQCLDMREFLTLEEAAQLLEIGLYYPEVNGTIALRQRIAALYKNAGPENVLVTVGAAQANLLVCSTLLQPGDEVVVVSPGYRQVWGLAKNFGCRVRELPLSPDNNWKLDLAKLRSLVNPRTKMVAVVNPNNPTGSVLSAQEMSEIVEICESSGCWLHADEVYCGTELDGEETPSFWRMYDKVVCVNSLSKAYGLAGLRIGWVLAAPNIIEDLWRRHEYQVIAASGPSMKLAEIALTPEKRKTLLDRQRNLSRQGHALIENWVRQQDGRFSVIKPQATSIAFVRYHFDLPSVEFADQIRKETSLLVAPGAYLGTEYHLRLGIGYAPAKLNAALERISKVAEGLHLEAGRVSAR